MQPDQFLNKCQSDPAAFMSAASHVRNAVEALEDARHGFSRNPDPGIANGESGDPPLLTHHAQLHLDLTLEGELEGVGDQVEDDLLPHLSVHIDRFAERGAIDREPQACPFRRRTEHAGQLGGEGGQIGRLIDCLDPASLDT